MDVDKQASTKHCMPSYHHHIFSVTDCAAFNHIYNCQNRKSMWVMSQKNVFCAPAAIPASLLTLNMNKNEDKHQQTGPLTLQKEYPGLAAHSVPTSSSTMHHFCWHKEIFIRAVHPKTGQMFTLKTQVIKIEFYCVQVKDKNLERQTQTLNMTDRAK